jgi:hypothetical protein
MSSIGARAFTAIMRSKKAASVSVMRPRMVSAALFTSASTLPKAAMASAASFSGYAGSSRLPWQKAALSSPSSFLKASPRAASRPCRMTFAPSAMKRRAMNSPMPVVLPVMRMTWS